MLLCALAPCSLPHRTMATLVAPSVFPCAPRPVGAAYIVRALLFTCTPVCRPLPAPCGHTPPALFSPQSTMSDRSTLSQDSPSPAPDTSRGGAIRRGPFPMFLMDIAESDDADRLLRELDILKDDALEAADTAIRATDPALADLCDALRWTAADGNIQAITAVTGAWTPRGLLLTATVMVATGPSDVKVVEHVPLSLVQGGPLLEYISKDPEALTAALVTRWSPGHVPISASRLRSQVFRGLCTAREQPPPIDTATPPDIQSQKVSHKIHKPINQFLAPHLRPASTPGPQPPPSPCCRPASPTPPAPLHSRRPATHPTSPKARQRPAPPALYSPRRRSPQRQPYTGPRTSPPQQGPNSRLRCCCLSRPGSPSAFPNPPPKSDRVPQTPHLRSRQPRPSDRPPPAPPSWESPLSRTWT